MKQHAGRYAPSPSGDLHIGNLRTALVAWAVARNSGRKFYVRVEDIDEQRSRPEFARQQLQDLADIGIDWDGEVLYQHDRYQAYAAALERLPHYECYCSRREIREAARAPHQRPEDYPGTCRDLTWEEREVRRRQLREQNREPAVRLRAEVQSFVARDALHGLVEGPVDDMVLRRGGQEPGWAYNLAVVVDDGFQGVDQVVRGDDLLYSAPQQAYLAQLLGLSAEITYVHVPLVLNAEGQRLAKRDGAVTLRDLHDPRQVLALLATSLGVPDVQSAGEFAERFSLERIPRAPWVYRGV